MKKIRGTITPALLVITGTFLVVIYGLLFLLTTQLDFSHRRVSSEQSLNIAEAGINYYRWHLAHSPDDFTDGTGEPGPYVHKYYDPQGKEIGYYSLEIIPPANGSTIVTIKSTGVTNSNPGIKRTIIAQYGKPSLSRFVFLNNASTWYGPGITVNGDVHSDNGIRMDGTNTGKVTSAKDVYICGSETGCNPATEKPGVWGSGEDKTLWEFPVTPVDFNSISFDFDSMKTSAMNNGLYLEPSTKAGYHIILNNTTITVKKVLTTNYIYGRDAKTGCQKRYQLITGESNVGNYNVSSTPIIFAEDDLWVEGTLDGKVTIVAAGFPLSSQNKNIWIRNNITYNSYDGSDSLGIIAQHDIYFVRDLPNDFKIDAALMAQKGHVIRHGYYFGCGTSSTSVRNSLTINGALISYNKSYWNYNSPPVSGFVTRTINYDSNLLYAPPPFFPTTDQYQFISWKEE